MTPFKDALRNAAGKHFASTILVLDNLTLEGSFTNSKSLVANWELLPGWVDEAVKAVSSKHKIHHNAWGLVTDASAKEVLQSATSHHNAGTIFRSGRRLPQAFDGLDAQDHVDVFEVGMDDKVDYLAENEGITVAEALPKPKMTQAERLLALRICYG
eukprot:4734183-Amphidinium_carterae.2